MPSGVSASALYDRALRVAARSRGEQERVELLVEPGGALLRFGEVAGSKERLRLPGYQWWDPMWAAMLSLLGGRLGDVQAPLRARDEVAAAAHTAADALSRIEDANPQVNAFVRLCTDRALAEADAVCPAIRVRSVVRPRMEPRWECS